VLFTSFRLGPYRLKNRLVALPVFGGYARPDGRASDWLIDHYAAFARSGVAMVIVANAAIAAAFGDAAVRACTAGFDAVEWHGATGYLLAQFLSGFSHKDTSESPAGFGERIRFPLRVVREVKRRLPPGCLLGFRFLLREWVPGGIDLDQALAFAETLAAEGINHLSPSVADGPACSSIDGFAQSPISALRFTPPSLRRTGCTPRSAGFARLDLRLRAKPSGLKSIPGCIYTARTANDLSQRRPGISA
jgi:2,4-dienoyl-CoA reductase-like NADH-dependent reductase (Old Yellow Enzyme family)